MENYYIVLPRGEYEIDSVLKFSDFPSHKSKKSFKISDKLERVYCIKGLHFTGSAFKRKAIEHDFYLIEALSEVTSDNVFDSQTDSIRIVRKVLVEEFTNYLDTTPLLLWKDVSLFLSEDLNPFYSLGLISIYKFYLNFDVLLTNIKLDKTLIETYCFDIYSTSITLNPSFTVDMFHEYYDSVINYDLLAENENFSASFFVKNYTKYKKYFRWDSILKNKNISLDFLKDNASDIGWNNISSFANLTDEFIEENKSNLDLKIIKSRSKFNF